MMHGINYTELVAASERSRRITGPRATAAAARSGRLRSLLGGALVALGERIAGPSSPAIAGIDPCT